ncbi:hypothetical protein HDU97_006716 [Phlyctochytrium planicorne]|nr:hypothetical protein HDU97_006716 [Phlyctochytrium planicorne]
MLILFIFLLSVLTTGIHAAPVNAAAATDLSMYLGERTTRPKPVGYDRKMTQLRSHLSSVAKRIQDIDAAHPGAKQFLDDILEVEKKIPQILDGLLTQNTTASNPSISRRAGSGSGGISAQTSTTLSIFAQFSTLSYCDLGSLNAWNCAGCKDWKVSGTRAVRTFSASSTGMQGYVAINDQYQTIVVAFRGSKNFQNWVENLKFLKAELSLPGADGTIKVHDGFWNVWSSVRDSVRGAISEFRGWNPNYSITFVGHSLGAATTTLAAVDSVVSGLIPAWKISLYTQGSPRVGNAAFYRYVTNIGFSGVYRGVHYNDLVTYLPPQALLFNHVTREHWITDNENVIVICDDIYNNGEDT